MLEWFDIMLEKLWYHVGMVWSGKAKIKREKRETGKCVRLHCIDWYILQLHNKLFIHKLKWTIWINKDKGEKWWELAMMVWVGERGRVGEEHGWGGAQKLYKLYSLTMVDVWLVKMKYYTLTLIIPKSKSQRE